MSANFPNEDPFAPWNRADYYADQNEGVYCPWQDDNYREDSTAPWNNTSDPVPFEWLARDWNRDNPHVPITLNDGLGPDPHSVSREMLRCPYCGAQNDANDARCPHLVVVASLEEWEDWTFEDEPVVDPTIELPPLVDPARAGKCDLLQEVANDEAERPDLTRLYPDGPGTEGSKLELYTLAAERTGGRAIIATFESGSMAGGVWTEFRVYSAGPPRFREVVEQLIRRLAEIRFACGSSSQATGSP